MSIQEISTGFIPRRFQLELRSKLKRFNVIICHRRFGKTVFGINHQIDKLLRNNNPMPRAAYIAPTFGQAKRVAWDYVKKYSNPIPGVTYHEQDLRADFLHNKARHMLLSGENPDSIKGIYLDDALLDEFGSMHPIVWTEVVRPTLSERAGTATFIGTSKGRNHLHKMYEYATKSGDPEWFGAIYRASETGILSKDELESARKVMPEEEYMQEYECSFDSGMASAYFTKEISKAESEKRITTVYYDPTLPVDTYWDLGIDDMTSVWFVQSVRGRHRVIDYYEVCGSSIPEVMADIKKKPYSFGVWVFPHDVKARDFSTGKSQQQTFYNHGARPSRVVPRVGTKRDSINAARMIFPLCEFDEKKCEKGLNALKNYQRKWNAKNNVFEESPLHNWASNGADAFQCFGLGVRSDSRDSSDSQEFERGGRLFTADMDYNPFQRGQL